MLVLCHVFVPVPFVSRMEGQFYRHFDVAISGSTIILTPNSFMVSPVLAALLLKPEHDRDVFQRGIDRVLGAFFRGFNRVFGRVSEQYGKRVCTVIAQRRFVLAAFMLLLLGTWLMFRVVPGGFIPAQDKQYLVGIVQLPDAASLDRTEDVVRRMSEIAMKTPGVQHAIGFPGLSANGFVSLDNAAVMFLPLKDFEERDSKELSAEAIAGQLQQQFASIGDAIILVVPPPPVQGL